MIRRYTRVVSFLVFTLAWSFVASAQQVEVSGDKTRTPVERRQMIAIRATRAPVIDGILEPEVYDNAPSSGDFTNLEPTFGPIESWPTSVKVIYDDRALYIAAEMWYPTIDSLSKEIRPRDQIGNADWFGVAIDPYLSGINGFEFISVVTGGQFDAILSDNGEDENWDAVWKNAVQYTDEGWTLEMEIPYSAIRFPDKPIQTWGINFFRRNAAAQQKSFWSPLDPNKPGFVPQFGQLVGIENISPPPRIQLSPFAVASGADYIDKAFAKTHNFDFSASAGADLKIGLSDAFTLDATLIPDFSEARQDNQVLNLSPFEVRFNENRPFFTEGVELFNKGGFFYSRRVGGTPLGFGEAYAEADRIGGQVVSNPQAARLLNATKVSGRTTKGTGIGIFHAVSGEARAILKTADGDEFDFQTQPLTTYSVVVVDQLIPHNGFISLVNTNVLRSGSTYDANLTGLVFDIRNKQNTYGFSGDVSLSQRYFEDNTDLGHSIDLNFGDIDGNWSWNIGYEEIGANYNPSDLGFFTRRNTREVVASVNYFQAKEIGPFNRIGGGSNAGYERYIEPNTFSEFWFNVYSFARTKSNWSINPYVYAEPFITRDRFEPRVANRYFERPAFSEAGFSVNSDQRKPLYFFFYGSKETFYKDELGRKGFNFGFGPTWRASNQFTLGMSINAFKNSNEGGFAAFVNQDQTAPVFGQRDRTSVENGLSIIYTISPTLGFTLNTRHYWSQVKYERYFDLTADGGLVENADYELLVDRDETFNALTSDLICRWRFAPGSDLLLVYKDALFAGSGEALHGYFDTWRNGLMGEPRTETLTLKLNYFLDWNELKRT